MASPPSRGGVSGLRALTTSSATLVTGTAGSQLLIVASAPILTRLYEPADLGILALFLSVLSVAGVAACLRYELAIPLPESDRVARALVAICIVAAGGVASVVAIGVYIWGNDALVVLNAGALVPYVWALPVGILFLGLHQTLTYWGIRRHTVGRVAASRVTQTVATLAVQVPGGVARMGTPALVIGSVFGHMVATVVLAGRHVRGPSFGASPLLLRRTAKRYRRFPLVTTWSALLNAMSVYAPVVLLSLLHSPAVVGWFALTVRVLQVPAATVSQAVAQAFFGHTSRLVDVRERPAYAKAVWKTLLAMATAPVAMLMLLGPQAFTLVFGPEWMTAGTYASWLAPWTLFVFAASPLSSTVYIMGRQRAELGIQLVMAIVRPAAIIAGAQLGGSDAAVLGYGVMSALSWFAYATWLLSLNGINLAGSLRALAVEIAAAVAIVAPSAMAVALDMTGPIFALAVGGSSATYVIYLASKVIGIRRWVLSK